MKSKIRKKKEPEYWGRKRKEERKKRVKILIPLDLALEIEDRRKCVRERATAPKLNTTEPPT